MSPATEKAKRSVWTRAPRLAQNAIGQPFRLRTAPGCFVRGIISECEFYDVRVRAASVVAQFRLFITGPTGFRFGPYFVENLPRSR